MKSLLKQLSKRALGAQKERLAERYLCARGVTIVARNYSCRCGEIDLVVEHDDSVIFVEVRYRKNAQFGGAAASIDRTKQQKIIRSAEDFLQHHPQLSHRCCRFDVIAIEGERVNWIKDAFQA